MPHKRAIPAKAKQPYPMVWARQPTSGRLQGRMDPLGTKL
jgi:hypothetical protein